MPSGKSFNALGFCSIALNFPLVFSNLLIAFTLILWSSEFWCLRRSLTVALRVKGKELKAISWGFFIIKFQLCFFY